jgi:enoyl-CoA hydratase
MSEIEVTHEGAATIIRINRPHRRNAINGATAAELRRAWQAFDAADSARVGILTGGDDVFCAGADLKELDTLMAGLEGDEGPLGFTRLSVRKPTIAAIAGYAVAGGLEIACWCDLRIADETAVFGCFERRFGVPLVDGGTIRLPQIVGVGRALEMILTGRAVHAAEAHMWGLANEVVPRGQHLTRALELAQLLASFPQTAMLNDRRSLYESMGKDMRAALQNEARLGIDTLSSGEFASGAQQFQSGKGRGGEG